MGHKTVSEKNLDNFINNNYDKNDRQKNDFLKFEWFVNSMHIWHCSSQYYNSKSQVGKEISLGNAEGGDAFFIIVNNEQVFTINDNIEDILKYIVEKGSEIGFQFIQTKKSKNVDWGDFLKLLEIVLVILKGENINSTQKELNSVKKIYDNVTNTNTPKLTTIKHKLDLFFYVDKNENEVEKLKENWKEKIERHENNLKEYINDSHIHIRGSSYINDLYEKFTSNKYELIINKSEVIADDDLKYLIGFITAKELLDSIAPITKDNERSILPDVFKNNIRLYIGNTNVNDKIELTLNKEADKFHYYNNGLTITTKEIDCSHAKIFRITPVNIVNGCQTANSIYNIFKSNHENENNVKIPVRIIVAEDIENEKITIRTNAQNGLEEKDLVSITNIQKELDEDFKRINYFNKSYFYKRQNSVDVNIPEIDFIIKIDDILRATFSTLLLIPDKVSGYFDQTTLKYIEIIFDENFKNLYIILTAILKIIDTKIEKDYKELNRLKYHFCYLFYKYVNKDKDLKIITEYFRKRNTNNDGNNEEDIKLINILIKEIYENLYKYISNEDHFYKIFKYIVENTRINYPKLIDYSKDDNERLLYKPVEKLYRTRTADPVFEDFNSIFKEKIEEIIK